jgi:hypothetical protein
MADPVLNDANLGTLLGALASRAGTVPKYRYPSAGTLYPVQAYVVLRAGTAAIAAGSYYYDPQGHELVALSPQVPTAPDGSTPPMLLMLAAQRSAIEPIYGTETEPFSLLEAGYMTEALRGEAAELSLRDAGDPAAHAGLIEACRLEATHQPLVCLAIGEKA